MLLIIPLIVVRVSIVGIILTIWLRKRLTVELLRGRSELSYVSMWEIGRWIWHWHVEHVWFLCIVVEYSWILLCLIGSIPSIIQSHHFGIVHVIHTLQIFLIVLIPWSTHISIVRLSFSCAVPTILVMPVEPVISPPVWRSSSLSSLVRIFPLRFFYLFVWIIVNRLLHLSCTFWLQTLDVFILENFRGSFNVVDTFP